MTMLVGFFSSKGLYFSFIVSYKKIDFFKINKKKERKGFFFYFVEAVYQGRWLLGNAL